MSELYGLGDIEALAGLAKRLESDRDFMAYVLAAYRRQEGLSEKELAAEFGVLPPLLVRLALCKRPTAGTPNFAKDIRRLADATLIDEAILANVLNQIEIVERLSDASGSDRKSSPLEGLLAAARDRTEKDTESPSPLNGQDADENDTED
ncbi:MAG: hypothetical protein ACREDR_02630 [Blastocatellia bacterium]